MSKLKTHKGSKKRFRITAKGRVKRSRAFKSHIKGKMSSKRKRLLRKKAYLSSANESTIKSMLPYQ